MKLFRTLSLLAALALPSLSQAATLQNVSFSDYLSDWSVIGGSASVDAGVLSLYPGAGSVNVWQTASESLGAGFALWYNVATTDGTDCGCSLGDMFSINYKDGGGLWKNLVTLNSTNVGGDSTGWIKILLPSDTTGLSFSVASDGDDYYTQGFLKVAAVPEPGEWAMILAGLGMISVIARRRNSKI